MLQQLNEFGKDGSLQEVEDHVAMRNKMLEFGIFRHQSVEIMDWPKTKEIGTYTIGTRLKKHSNSFVHGGPYSSTANATDRLHVSGS